MARPSPHGQLSPPGGVPASGSRFSAPGKRSQAEVTLSPDWKHLHGQGASWSPPSGRCSRGGLQHWPDQAAGNHLECWEGKVGSEPDGTAQAPPRGRSAGIGATSTSPPQQGSSCRGGREGTGSPEKQENQGTLKNEQRQKRSDASPRPPSPGASRPPRPLQPSGPRPALTPPSRPMASARSRALRPLGRSR